MVYNLEEEYSRYVQEIGGRLVSSEKPRGDIRRTRLALGVTQEELGRLMKLRRETISRIETGSISPTFAFVKKFSRTMAVARIIRDLLALEEVSVLDGRSFSISPALLRVYFNVPMDNLRLISDIEIRGYQKSKAKIIKEIKEVV